MGTMNGDEKKDKKINFLKNFSREEKLLNGSSKFWKGFFISGWINEVHIRMKKWRILFADEKWGKDEGRKKGKRARVVLNEWVWKWVWEKVCV